MPHSALRRPSAAISTSRSLGKPLRRSVTYSNLLLPNSFAHRSTESTGLRPICSLFTLRNIFGSDIGQRLRVMRTQSHSYLNRQAPTVQNFEERSRKDWVGAAFVAFLVLNWPCIILFSLLYLRYDCSSSCLDSLIYSVIVEEQLANSADREYIHTDERSSISVA